MSVSFFVISDFRPHLLLCCWRTIHLIPPRDNGRIPRLLKVNPVPRDGRFVLCESLATRAVDIPPAAAVETYAMSATEWEREGEGAFHDRVWGDDDCCDDEAPLDVSLEAELSGLGTDHQRPHGAISSPGAPFSSSDHAAAAVQVEEVSARPVSAFTSAFTNAKAGMEGVDKDKVKRVVHEMSKDSSHFHNETRKENAVEERIRAMQKRWNELRGRRGQRQRADNDDGDINNASEYVDNSELSAVRAAVERRVAVLEAGRDLSHTWIHVDMDAFFAAVHELERPELKTLPVAVGGISMISTANYEARKHGVRSAMPGFIAKKLCPNLVFVAPDFNLSLIHI